MTTFWLGVPEPAWLKHLEVPLFVSHHRLQRRRTMPRAVGPWALDSGGFTQLERHGRWTIDAPTYAEWVRCYVELVGNLEWAAPQDWMCEPFMLEKTGLTVRRHQELTCDNFEELRMFAPDLPIIPVLQGWELADYVEHIRMYASIGIHLEDEPLVGVGSVCRRQDTDEIAAIFGELSQCGFKMHGFGVKTGGLEKYGPMLSSADSQAWSAGARRRNVWLQECQSRGHHKPPDCRNCWRYALYWRKEVVMPKLC